jgi:hypothetical protein
VIVKNAVLMRDNGDLRMKKIHADLMWETILNRINLIRKDAQFRLWPDGSIHQLVDNSWHYLCKTNYDKSKFIEEEAYIRYPIAFGGDLI